MKTKLIKKLRVHFSIAFMSSLEDIELMMIAVRILGQEDLKNILDN